MMLKLQKASAKLEVDTGIEDLQLLMPPTREIKVRVPRSRLNVREDPLNARAPSDGSFLGHSQHQRPLQEQNLDQSNAAVYADRAVDIIARAQKGKPMTDHYDFRYLDRVIQAQARHFPGRQSYGRQQDAFLNYTRYLMTMFEGKHFSKRSDVP